MKRLNSPVLNKLRQRRRGLQRQINKINGHRPSLTWWLEEGETWMASSYPENLEYARERLLRKERLSKLTTAEILIQEVEQKYGY